MDDERLDEMAAFAQREHERADRAEAALAAHTLALEDCRDGLCLSGQTLAEARGLLERCIWHTDADDYHCLPCAHCRDNIRAYLDRTRDGAVPAQAPCALCGKPADMSHDDGESRLFCSASCAGYYGDGFRAPTPAPRCHYCDHEDPYHSPRCTRPARRGAP